MTTNYGPLYIFEAGHGLVSRTGGLYPANPRLKTKHSDAKLTVGG